MSAVPLHSHKGVAVPRHKGVDRIRTTSEMGQLCGFSLQAGCKRKPTKKKYFALPIQPDRTYPTRPKTESKRLRRITAFGGTLFGSFKKRKTRSGRSESVDHWD